ncbi:hypothetical protein BaRGS_00035132 [Batillaria attramentaria]|uniref:Uncharacterized protein n=1 Tax=Batillaria attramentaria TaxID=370345 RepID=A0ABD0JFX0_9CAEN
MLKTYLGSSADIFTVIGVVVTTVCAFKVTSSFFNGLLSYILSGMLGLSFNFKSVGSWAVVTGCTDGIGKAYAEELARRGLNVVLISRTRSKLEALAQEIKERFKVETRIIAADFTRADIYDDIRKELSGLDIGTLVNNVGMAYDYPEYFHLQENNDKFVMDMINCNTASVAMMTSMMLPGMVAKKKGVIINISSGFGRFPAPLVTVYSATKCFVDFFSRALQQEYGPMGITIQVVMPYFVATKMSKIRRTSMFVPSPTDYVRSALNTVGLQGLTFGYWTHALQEKFVSVTPLFFIKQTLLGTRARALKRKASKKE